jgi:hypothetical protein
MKPGDYALSSYGNAYHHAARVLGRYDNRRFAERVWGTDHEGRTWRYMYFLTEPVVVDRRVPEVGNYLNAAYRGFTKIHRENAGSAWDFSVCRDGERLLLDAKSTESNFNNKLHISLGELRQMSYGTERYDIYRVFEMSEATAKLRIAEDLRDWARAIIEVLDNLPEGVTADNISVPPSYLPFGPTVEVYLLA